MAHVQLSLGDVAHLLLLLGGVECRRDVGHTVIESQPGGVEEVGWVTDHVLQHGQRGQGEQRRRQVRGVQGGVGGTGLGQLLVVAQGEGHRGEEEVDREGKELPEEALLDVGVPLGLEQVHDDVLDEVEVLEVGPEHDQVEGRLGLELPGLRVDGVQILQRVETDNVDISR